MSPESLLGQKSLIGFASDMWSFGVIVWQMFSLNNSTPFEANNPEETIELIRSC